MHLKTPVPRLAAMAGLAAILMSAAPAAQAKDNTGAILGAAAAGVAGGVIAGALINGSQAAPPRPAYGPPPGPVYIERPAPIERRVAFDPESPQEVAFRLHAQCDDGNRKACIRFGMMIGQNRERRAEWARNHPDMFAWER